jgi:Myb-like DNA-binding domain
MNEMGVLEVPAQPLDHTPILDPEPTINLNEQQLTKIARSIPVPLPSKFSEQNEAPQSNGKKRNKQTSPSRSSLAVAAAPEPTASLPCSPLADAAAAGEEAAKRQRRQRVLVDMHNQKDGKDNDNEQGVIENAYERERLERIKRNQEVMQQMGLRQLAVQTATVARPVFDSASGEGNHSSKPRRRAGPNKKDKFSAAQAGPRRSSARNRHQAGEYSEKTDITAFLQDGATDDDVLEPLTAEDFLLGLEDYFKLNNIDISNAVKVDGHYRGWVPKDVAETYGLPLEYPGDDWIRSAGAGAAAGPSSTSTGSGKRGRKKGGRGGGSDAKAKSSASLSYNPNAYFYRHVAPHQRQAQGEWTQEERDKFMEVVRVWGVGDSWGLFASHICQRVGYQCSAFYRDVIIPSGAVIDDRFKMTRSGKAVFVR